MHDVLVCRLSLSNIEGKPVDHGEMMRCQRTAMEAAAFSDAQRSDIVAAYSETQREVQQVEAEVGQLQERLAQVWLPSVGFCVSNSVLHVVNDSSGVRIRWQYMRDRASASLVASAHALAAVACAGGNQYTHRPSNSLTSPPVTS